MKFCPYCGIGHERAGAACCKEHGHKVAGMSASASRGRNTARRRYMEALQAKLRHVPTFRKAALGELSIEDAALSIFGTAPAPDFNDPSEGYP